MSASTIARWNAIPMTRGEGVGEGSENLNLKRPRPTNDNEDDDSSSDNISLTSRSPSPSLSPGPSLDNDDVTMHDLYDEHHRGAAREVITVETRIKSTNKGFAMLAKLGWKEGESLGLNGDGRVDPVPFTMKQDQTGLGKASQDVRMIETTVSQRRFLESERMRMETLEQRQARTDAVAQKAAVQSEVINAIRAFYCELCEKQFKNVAQYDEHTNSYAHHHKARLKELQAMHPLKSGNQEDIDRRKEKERKREEKELRKLAAARGIKYTAPVQATIPALAPVVPAGEPRKSGWATVSSTSSVGTSADGNNASPASASSSSGWKSVSQPAEPALPRGKTWTSGAGFVSSERSFSMTNSSGVEHIPAPPPPSGPPPPPPADMPPPPPTLNQSPPPPPPQSFHQPPPPPPNQNHAQPPPPPPPSQGGWGSPPPLPPSEKAPPSGSGGWKTFNSTSSSTLSEPVPMAVDAPPPPPPTAPAPNPPAAKVNEDNRSKSWQQFQKGRRKR